jgi:carbamoyl-phosphate synthase small subunit
VTSLTESRSPAHLVLEDGTTFRGLGFGAQRAAVGEVCFNTGMCGYQEVLTDPSYAGQIVVMTAPQMGNTGITAFDDESRRPHVAGFVVRNLSSASNWRSIGSLERYLMRHDVPGLYDVDTRHLTRLLREHGAQKGALGPSHIEATTLHEQAVAWQGLEGRDLARQVTCAEIHAWRADLAQTAAEQRRSTYEVGPAPILDASALHIVVIDFGVKANILHRLAMRGCRLTVVPATTKAEALLALEPHGVLLSNGPGDPLAVDYGIATVRRLIGQVPLFGICLGHQILGLALGGRRYKLKFGHRGVNHPVADRLTGKVRITSQNHGFGLDPDSLCGSDLEITEVSLNDGSVEGMRHRRLPIFSVQYHPEAAPGPHDNDSLFDRFLKMTAEHAGLVLPQSQRQRGGRHAAA